MLRTAIGVATLCAALLAVPDSAVGLKLKRSYEGTVATQGVSGQQPTIRLKVQHKRRDGKIVPVFVVNWQHRAIALFCSTGATTFVGPFNLESGQPTGWASPGLIGINVRKRKFKQTLTGDDADAEGGADLVRITGRVPRRGPAKGTIRLTTTHPTRGFCDSGVVSWAAPRVKAWSQTR